MGRSKSTKLGTTSKQYKMIIAFLFSLIKSGLPDPYEEDSLSYTDYKLIALNVLT